MFTIFLKNFFFFVFTMIYLFIYFTFIYYLRCSIAAKTGTPAEILPLVEAVPKKLKNDHNVKEKGMMNCFHLFGPDSNKSNYHKYI